MNKVTRRAMLAGAVAAPLMARSLASSAGNEQTVAGNKTRLIATEEAYASPAYLKEYLKLAATHETPVTRYLKMYYETPAVVKKLTDMSERLPEMDAHGVDMQILSLAAPGVQVFPAALGTALAKDANDYLVSLINANPTRFAGLAAVAPQEPEKAAQEIDRAMTQLNLNGVIINSHTQGEFLDERKFTPLLAAAEQYKAPIYLHPTFPPEPMLANYLDYGMMGALWGFKAECSLHVARMILGGVFDRHPDLTIVLGHLGEGLPYWLGRLDNRYQNIVRRGGLKRLGMVELQKLPSEYFASNFYVTTSGMNWFPPLGYCLKVLGEDRIMFAIDYPFEQTQDAAGLMAEAREQLSPAAYRKLAYANADRLFGLRVA